jgi:hypothetical protein
VTRCRSILSHEERHRSSFWYVVFFQNNGLGANFRKSVIPSTLLNLIFVSRPWKIILLSLSSTEAEYILTWRHGSILIFLTVKEYLTCSINFIHQHINLLSSASATVPQKLQMLWLPKINKMCLYILWSHSQVTRMTFLSTISTNNNRLCGLAVRVPGYTSRGPVFDSLCYKTFREVVGLEWGPLSLMSITEEQLGRNSSGSGLEIWEYGHGDLLRRPRENFYLQKLALTSPTCGSHSVTILRSRTTATEFFLYECITAPAQFSLFCNNSKHFVKSVDCCCQKISDSH